MFLKTAEDVETYYQPGTPSVGCYFGGNRSSIETRRLRTSWPINDDVTPLVSYSCLSDYFQMPLSTLEDSITDTIGKDRPFELDEYYILDAMKCALYIRLSGK